MLTVLKKITPNKTRIKIICSLLIFILILSIINLIIKFTTPVIFQNPIYLYSRVILLISLSSGFTFLTQNTLKNLISNIAKTIYATKISDLDSDANVLQLYNKTYTLKQFHKLRIIVYLYYFTTIYTFCKSAFYFALNESVPEIIRTPNKYQYSLYNSESNVYYSNQNVFEQQFFKNVDLFEYFFRIIFGFILPVFYILKLLKSECNNGQRTSCNSISKSINESQITDDSENIDYSPIDGLHYS